MTSGYHGEGFARSHTYIVARPKKIKRPNLAISTFKSSEMKVGKFLQKIVNITRFKVRIS